MPERLREIWWVRRMPQLVAGVALLVAIVLPLVVRESAHQQTYSLVLAFALCAVSVTVLTGWGGQLSLGQMAFAGIGALERAPRSCRRRLAVNIGWRLDPDRSRRDLPEACPFVARRSLLGVRPSRASCRASVRAALGALRVKGLLLAAARWRSRSRREAYIFGGRSSPVTTAR